MPSQQSGLASWYFLMCAIVQVMERKSVVSPRRFAACSTIEVGWKGKVCGDWACRTSPDEDILARLCCLLRQMDHVCPPRICCMLEEVVQALDLGSVTYR